jgi:hypothetical protein
MGASLHLAISTNTVPVAGDDGYIDLTSLTKSDWVRMGAPVYGDELIKLGIDEMFYWHVTDGIPRRIHLVKAPRSVHIT